MAQYTVSVEKVKICGTSGHVDIIYGLFSEYFLLGERYPSCLPGSIETSIPTALHDFRSFHKSIFKGKSLKLSFPAFADRTACHCQDATKNVPEETILHLPKQKAHQKEKP